MRARQSTRMHSSGKVDLLGSVQPRVSARNGSTQSMHYRFGEFEVDTTRELLIGPDGPIELRRQSWRMLCHLLERAPAVISRDELMDSLWGHDALSPNVVPQTLSELRQALNDDAQNARFIETRHRRGYAFVAELTKTSDEEDTTQAAEDLSSSHAHPGESPATMNFRVESPSQSVSTPINSPKAIPFWRRRAFAMIGVTGVVVAIAMAIFIDARIQNTSHGSVSTSRPVVAIAGDTGYADLAALTRLMLRNDDDVIVPAPDSPALAALGHAAPVLVKIDAGGRWMLSDIDGKSMASGTLPSGDLASQTDGLVIAIRSALNVRDRNLTRIGWPRDDAALRELAGAVAAYEKGRLDEAITGFEHVLTDLEGPSLPRLMLARAQLQSGDWKGAQVSLGDVRPASKTASTASALLIDALRAQLGGSNDESLAALRAYRHLVPDDIDTGLMLLDAQIGQGQWQAAEATIVDLAARAGWPDAQPLALWQARLEAAQGRNEQALDVLRPFIDAGKETARSREMMDAVALAANLKQRLGRGDEALRELTPMVNKDTPELAYIQGRITREAGQIDTAESAFELAATGYAFLGQSSGERRAQLQRAYIQLDRGNPAIARDSMLELLQLAEAAGEPSLLIDIHTGLGLAYVNSGDADAARANLELAVSVAEQTDDAQRRASAHLGLGKLLVRQGRLRDAEAAFDHAAENFRRANDPRGEATAMANLGALAARDGRRQQAREAYAIALERQRQLGAVMEVGRIAFNLGVLEREQGELDSSMGHFDEAFAALQKTDAIDFLLQVAASRAELELLRGKPEQAKAAIAAIDQYADRGSPMRRAAVIAAQGRIDEVAGRWDKSRENYEQARALRESAGAHAWIVATDLRLLRLALRESPKSERLRVRVEGLEAEFTRIGENGDAISAALTAAEAALAARDGDAADAILVRLRTTVQSRGNRLQQHQAAWISAGLAEGDERDERLLRLAAICEKEGFAGIALLAHAGREIAGSAAHRKRVDKLESMQLAGILARPSAAFQ